MHDNIFYDTGLTELARKLRKNQTPAEYIIWQNVLRNKKLGFKFTRQKPIGYYILDFYCSRLLLGIEIDGEIHLSKREYDAERTEEIKAYGIKIIRYSNQIVIENLEHVYADLEKQIQLRKKELGR